MHTLSEIRAIVFICAAPAALLAQPPRDVAPLKYWPAPLYWQPITI